MIDSHTDAYSPERIFRWDRLALLRTSYSLKKERTIHLTAFEGATEELSTKSLLKPMTDKNRPLAFTLGGQEWTFGANPKIHLTKLLLVIKVDNISCIYIVNLLFYITSGDGRDGVGCTGPSSIESSLKKSLVCPTWHLLTSRNEPTEQKSQDGRSDRFFSKHKQANNWAQLWTFFFFLREHFISPL